MTGREVTRAIHKVLFTLEQQSTKFFENVIAFRKSLEARLSNDLDGEIRGGSGVGNKNEFEDSEVMIQMGEDLEEDGAFTGVQSLVELDFGSLGDDVEGKVEGLTKEVFTRERRGEFRKERSSNSKGSQTMGRQKRR